MIRRESKPLFSGDLDVVNGKALSIEKGDEEEDLYTTLRKSSVLKNCGKMDATKLINSCLRSSPSR